MSGGSHLLVAQCQGTLIKAFPQDVALSDVNSGGQPQQHSGGELFFFFSQVLLCKSFSAGTMCIPFHLLRSVHTWVY